jgi:hypothetical protein
MLVSFPAKTQGLKVADTEAKGKGPQTSGMLESQ